MGSAAAQPAAKETAPKLSFALSYARHGCGVFPVHCIENDGECSCGKLACSSAGKHPMFFGWQGSATTDLAVIRRIWQEKPDANIGVKCGAESGITVLDVDGDEGRDRLRELELEFGDLPETPIATTGSGGAHYYFAFEDGLTNAVRFDKGLDVRTEGGYVVGVGSSTKGSYEWELAFTLGDIRPAKMPQWLIARIKTAGNAKRDGKSARIPEQKIHEHEGRNSFLYIEGRRLRQRGFPAEAIRAALFELNRVQCLPPVDAHEFETIVYSVLNQPDREDFADKGSGNSTAGGTEWLEPKEIDSALLPVPPFDLRLLPQPLRPWLADIAERSQCPPDFLAVGAIVVCASLIARHIAIRPKRHDDWTVTPNLWGGVIAPPGFLKSPALAETLKPLNRLAHEAGLRFKQELLDHETECLVQKAKRESIEQAIRSAFKQKDEALVKSLRADLEGLASEPPRETRMLVNDTTVEMLGAILNQNPGGVLIFRDELSGFLRSLERQGHEADQAFYCEAWNGAAPFTYDRIGRGTIHIARTCVSILGGIQPGPWRAYLRELFQAGRDDGFVSRFQLLVWPEVGVTWRNVDRWPDTAAKENAWRIFSALSDLKVSNLGAEQADGSELAFLRFAADAQPLFDEWRGDLEAKLRRDEEHPILVSHLAKYRKLMPALALVLHTVSVVEGSAGFGGGVSLIAATQAAAWCDFLEAHARRSYQSVTDVANTAAGALAVKIRNRKLASPFRARDVYQSGWSGLSERDDVYRAITMLEGANWLRPEEVKTDREHGGRPSIQFHINPKLFEAKK
jgi:hypothetical protein